MKRKFVLTICIVSFVAVWGNLINALAQEGPVLVKSAADKNGTISLVNTDFGNATLPRNNTTSDRVSGSITAPWNDDSSWANVSLKYQRMTEAGSSFQRVEISQFNSGQVQIMHPLTQMGGTRLYRLEATLRGTERLPLSLAVRHRGAPYSFLWRRDLILSPQWENVTLYFQMPLSTQPIGFFIQAGSKGVVDLQRLHLREVSREEVDTLTRNSLGGQIPTNFLRETRFPLGLPHGWAFTDNQRGNPLGFQIRSDAALTGPSGAPALQMRASESFRLTSPPFTLPLIMSPHVMSLWVKGEKPVTLTVTARNEDLVKKEFQLSRGLQWQRLELPFTPNVNADFYTLRLEGPAGDWALDGLQVNAGDKAPSYTGQWPAEVALRDEAGKSLQWAVTGAPVGAVLKIRSDSSLAGSTDTSLSLGAGYLQQGTRAYPAAVMGNGASVRTTAWVEDGNGKRLSASASLTAERSFFPFVIPWDDASPTFLDVSHLNGVPAGQNGFIQARGGHLVESGTGKRVRFIGVVFTAFQALPTHSDAEKVAARLAKYGVNLVRLHYIDNAFMKDGSLWDFSRPDRRHLDPAKLDRLDYLVAQLKKHGIYSNINLKVGREYRAEDGLPPSVSQLGGNAKRVDYFSRPLLQLQKEYARDLLTHVNPYTGNAYKSEPAVFCVEINNESSLGWDNLGMDLFGIAEPFREELRQLWNGWLSRKYSTTTQLQTAWNVTPQTDVELLKPALPLTNWKQEKRPAVTADVTEADGALNVNVKSTDGNFNSLQLAQNGLNLKEGQSYTVSFKAKGNRPVRVYAGADQGDYHGVGLWRSVAVTDEWKEHRFSFTTRNVVPDHTRLVFSFGENQGTIGVKDVSLRSGDLTNATMTTNTLENKTVVFPQNPSVAQRRDWVHFIAETELGYVRDMRKFLKDELGVKSLVSGSQTSFGGLLGIYREAELDFVDDHGYWDHPQKLAGAWHDQSVNNTPSVPVIGEGGTLAQLSRQRVAGKPFSVSEYNHPMPNEFQAECVPLLASFAAFQDWDVITLHEYGRYGAAGANDTVQDYFAVGANPAKWAFLPSAALMFRNAQMKPAEEQSTLQLPETIQDVPLLDTQNANGWLPSALTLWNKNPSVSGDPLRSRLALKLGETTLPSVPPIAQAAGPAKGGNTKLQVRKLEGGKAVYTAESESAKVVAGAVGGQTVSVDGASFQFQKTDHNFGVLSLVSMDGKALSASRKALLTIVARVQNTEPQWSPDRRRLISWGKAPILAEGVPVDVTLKVDGPRTVYALDVTGARLGQIKAMYKNNTLQFQVSPANGTTWFAVEG